MKFCFFLLPTTASVLVASPLFSQTRNRNNSHYALHFTVLHPAAGPAALLAEPTGTLQTFGSLNLFCVHDRLISSQSGFENKDDNFFAMQTEYIKTTSAKSCLSSYFRFICRNYRPLQGCILCISGRHWLHYCSSVNSETPPYCASVSSVNKCAL